MAILLVCLLDCLLWTFWLGEVTEERVAVVLVGALGFLLWTLIVDEALEGVFCFTRLRVAALLLLSED